MQKVTVPIIDIVVVLCWKVESPSNLISIHSCNIKL